MTYWSIFYRKQCKKLKLNGWKKYSMVKEVISLGFMMDPLLQRDLYYIFLIAYISSLLANITLDFSDLCWFWLHAIPCIFSLGIFFVPGFWYVSVYVLKILMTYLWWQEHLFCWLLSSALLLLCLTGLHWVLPVGCHGLWLCGNL